MHAITGYASRYIADVKSFSLALLASVAVLLPTFISIYKFAFLVAVALVLVIGLINVLAFSALTAFLDQLPFKLLIGIAALVANLIWLREPLTLNSTSLIFFQTYFLFGLFYVLWKLRRYRRLQVAAHPSVPADQ